MLNDTCQIHAVDTIPSKLRISPLLWSHKWKSNPQGIKRLKRLQEINHLFNLMFLFFFHFLHSNLPDNKCQKEVAHAIFYMHQTSGACAWHVRMWLHASNGEDYGLISPDLVESLWPVKYGEKSKSPRVIIEGFVLTEDDWIEKTTSKHDEEIQKELWLKLFHERKEIRKSEAAAKANKKANETSTITRPVEPTKTAAETIQQPPNTVPLETKTSLETKTKQPASTFSALTNITISIPEQRRSNSKQNGKKNFVLDELVFSSSDSSSEVLVKRSNMHGIVESVIRKHHRDIWRLTTTTTIDQTMVPCNLWKCWPW